MTTLMLLLKVASGLAICSSQAGGFLWTFTYRRWPGEVSRCVPVTDHARWHRRQVDLAMLKPRQASHVSIVSFICRIDLFLGIKFSQAICNQLQKKKPVCRDPLVDEHVEDVKHGKWEDVVDEGVRPVHVHERAERIPL